MWMMLTQTQFEPYWLSSADECPITSHIHQAPIARMLSIQPQNSGGAGDHTVEHEMNIWLDQSKVNIEQSTFSVRMRQPYGVTTLFGCLEHSNELVAIASFSGNESVPCRRFSGWIGAHKALGNEQASKSAAPDDSLGVDGEQHGAVNYVVEHTQADTSSTSILDICAQELFVALMLSLVDFDIALIGLALSFRTRTRRVWNTHFLTSLRKLS
jgi:hypothetical protein